MKKILLYTFFIILILVLSSCLPHSNNNEVLTGDVLFDNAHSQTAGNADWTITGGFSDFANDIKKIGLNVQQWGNDETGSSQRDDDAPITYDTLKNFKVYIIPEPNKPFTSQEQADIIKYINDGGSVFFISDHIRADRNNNGWDAVQIFNGFKRGTHTIENKNNYTDDFVGKLGFRFREVQYSQDPITNMKTHEITNGVTQVGMWAGSTLYIKDSNINGLVYLTNENSGPYVIAGTYGKGKFVAIGDSSPIDDGSGADSKLYDGYNDLDDAKLCMNIIKWLNK
ncbi:hypothetical protein OSSY52_08640 [Tepiditoga spiralis]|uniref:DNA-binding protein n=1 Tax=Tepiditoga spiralis TaxID=2108365 RepID=A0A7G1G769_9BACT|nr:hypothetical protein [Tepiditoga spiralis]BBE30723.1 hypothetical protein OSSY52_08640 [Tepiditoga spiralis]